MAGFYEHGTKPSGCEEGGDLLTIWVKISFSKTLLYSVKYVSGCFNGSRFEMHIIAWKHSFGETKRGNRCRRLVETRAILEVTRKLKTLTYSFPGVQYVKYFNIIKPKLFIYLSVFLTRYESDHQIIRRMRKRNGLETRHSILYPKFISPLFFLEEGGWGWGVGGWITKSQFCVCESPAFNSWTNGPIFTKLGTCVIKFEDTQTA